MCIGGANRLSKFHHFQPMPESTEKNSEISLIRDFAQNNAASTLGSGITGAVIASNPKIYIHAAQSILDAGKESAKKM